MNKQTRIRVNDMVIRFANVNGTGSASANDLFSKAVFRMGIPLSSKNFFPSNIQGLPTWYEVRVSEKGYTGRRAGVDLLVAVNPQTFAKDVASVVPGGYFVYDSTKPLHDEFIRSDIHYIGVPMMQLCMDNYDVPRQQQLFKNIVYIGALAALLDVEMEVIREIIRQMFAKKEKLIPANFKALDLGSEYVKKHFSFPLDIRLERRNLLGDQIFMDGNAAAALGALYGGVTFAAWYPITPSTSVISSFEKYCAKYRVAADGTSNVAIVQAEDELAAIGMVIGAAWNGARSFTSTSGAGVSLMTEFLGLAYFAEVPAVIVNVQRGGPSTGMPTRTQQSDILSCAYASHGDTKHVLLFPSTPAECFEMTAQALDLAERLQTPVFVMTDLDLGMNLHLSPPLKWDDKRRYDRGKVLNREQLDELKQYGRYLDVDGDGICYRTLPGTHPTKGSFFTRGTSRDEFARYTEEGDVYVRNMQRLQKKWNTAAAMMPKPEVSQGGAAAAKRGVVFFGTSTFSTLEALDILADQGQYFDVMRIRAFPFGAEVEAFIREHDEIFVVEQNRDAQMRTVIMTELETDPRKLISVLNYDGMPITAAIILEQIRKFLPETKSVPV